MRIEAVHDASGVIVAAIEVPAEGDPYPRPVAGDGQSVDLFDIPEEFGDLSLEVICTSVLVDAKRKLLVPVDESSST
ncbi:MAG: hypothetical protein WAL25_03975 [Acidimicrobiia bacterium]